MSKENREKTGDFFKSWINKKVRKPSNKPFKSTFLINTVKDVTVNTNTNLPAFTFLEDESIVDCHQCQCVAID